MADSIKLPPQPTIQMGRNEKAKPQLWFTWAEVKEFATKAIEDHEARYGSN